MAHIYDYYYVGDQNLFLNDFTRKPPTLLAFSKIQNGIKGETKTHLHAHLELFYFESGNGFFEANNKTFPIKPHDLLFINAKQLHLQYSLNASDPLTYYCFAIDNVQLKRLNLNTISNDTHKLFSYLDGDNIIYNNIHRLLDEFRKNQYGYHSKTYHIFMEIFIDTLRLFNIGESEPGVLSEKNNNNLRILSTIKQFIDENYTEDINLDQLTKLSFMNKSYFLNQFKKSFNVSPMQYLMIVRVEQSKLLLTKTDSSIMEIASLVGFNNPVYFTEVFSRMIGVSPTNYRKIVTR